MKSVSLLLTLFLWYGIVSSNDTRNEMIQRYKNMRHDSKQNIGDRREIKEQLLETRDDEGNLKLVVNTTIHYMQLLL